MRKKEGLNIGKQIAPKWQALSIIIVMMIANSIVVIFGIGDEKFPWIIALAFVFLYIIFNSILLVFAPKLRMYLSESITFYALLVLLTALFTYIISGVSFTEVSNSIRPIFIVFTMGYIVFLAITISIKLLIRRIDLEEQKKLSGKTSKKKE